MLAVSSPSPAGAPSRPAAAVGGDAAALGADIWERFRSAPSTLGPEPGVRDAWHRGRHAYAVWVYRIRDERVAARVARVRAALGRVLEPIPDESLHVTVHVVGFPCTGATGADDEVTATVLEAQRAAAAAERVAPSLAVGGASSYLTAAFLDVDDPSGRLLATRARLEACRPEPRTAPYRAHVTVGTYRACLPIAPLAARLAPLRALPAIEIAPDRLELVELHPQRARLSFVTRAAVELTAAARAVTP